MAPSSRSRTRASMTTSAMVVELPVMKERLRRRVTRACDSCRIRKTKCDGDKHCMKHTNENQAFAYTQCNKMTGSVVPPEYVELLELKVKLLTSSLSILAEAVSQGRDLSHLAQNPDTPIKELVDKLQAMGNRQKMEGGLRPNQNSYHCQNDTVKMSPVKHFKFETSQRLPVARDDIVRHNQPALNNKSLPALFIQEAPLDFFRPDDSQIFREPGSKYPMSVELMLTPQEYSENQHSPSKLMQVSPKIEHDFPKSPSSANNLPSTQDGIVEKYDCSFTSFNRPVLSGPPHFQVLSSEPNSIVRFPSPTPILQRSVNSPPLSFDMMSEDESNDILTDTTEDFLHWQQM